MGENFSGLLLKASTTVWLELRASRLQARHVAGVFLAVAVERDDHVAGGVCKAGRQGRRLAEVAVELDDADVAIRGAQRVQAFRRALEQRGFAAMVRKNRGRDIAAACGQLAVAGQERRARPAAGAPA